MEIRVRNVNGALAQGVWLFKMRGSDAGLRKAAPRGAETLEIAEPVLTVYDQPCERVLFHSERDANPFFHFFESLWMLAGRRDAEFVTRLVKRMASYSDDGLLMQGSYGYRWRTHFGFDQLCLLEEHLRSDPRSRRAVLAMWDPRHDLPIVDNSKDVPCNTTIYFKIHNGRLDMTVCNRSNDMLWGAYGANAVHMSFLQEYMADRLGLPVGRYYQFSDSFHVYLGGPGGAVWERLCDSPTSSFLDKYITHDFKPFRLGAGENAWVGDLHDFFTAVDSDVMLEPRDFQTPFFRQVVRPLWNAYEQRAELGKAMPHLRECAAADWYYVCMDWLLRHGGAQR